MYFLADIQIAEEIHAGKQFNVVVFYVLKLLMAPVIEGLLLVDRLIYVREKHPGRIWQIKQFVFRHLYQVFR
jgi:hypothetical protein